MLDGSRLYDTRIRKKLKEFKITFRDQAIQIIPENVIDNVVGEDEWQQVIQQDFAGRSITGRKYKDSNKNTIKIERPS